MIKPRNMSSARVALLTALRKLKSLPTALRNNRASMAEETHNARISTAPAVSAPSIIVRKLIVELPMVQVMASSSLSTTGSKPLTQSAIPSQAIQEIECSSALTHGAVANATLNTLTPTRMTTSETNTGMATLKTANGTNFSSAARAM